MQVLTTLYKESSTGGIQQWKVFTEGNKVTVEFGQVDGKLQTKDTFCSPKNIGKANETSPEEQAALEAVSKWEKQVKKGYVECTSGKRVVNLPMKVKSYFDGTMKEKVNFPATIGRKLNGVNAECRLNPDGTIVQLSRGGEEYPLPPAAAQLELRNAMTVLDATAINYEIYLHNKHLQDIVGAVKAPKNHTELWKKLEYHIFDIPSNTSNWEGRLKKLGQLTDAKFVKVVQNYPVISHDEIITYQDQFIAKGYEGSIVRNLSGIYEYNKRSSDVFKVKYVQSDEFKIVSYTLDKNNHPVFSCSAKGGDFKVKPKGTAEQRDEIRQQATSWVGKWMTVEYEMLSKDGIPLKPVGIGLREGYEKDGTFVPTE